MTGATFFSPGVVVACGEHGFDSRASSRRIMAAWIALVLVFIGGVLAGLATSLSTKRRRRTRDCSICGAPKSPVCRRGWCWACHGRICGYMGPHQPELPVKNLAREYDLN